MVLVGADAFGVEAVGVISFFFLVGEDGDNVGSCDDARGVGSDAIDVDTVGAGSFTVRASIDVGLHTSIVND